MISISQKTFATWLGVILVLVGILGLFTKEYVIGMFAVNSLHTWIHLISGIFALLAGLTAVGAYAGTYNKLFGTVYLLIGILGLAGLGFLVELLTLNTSDNILHLLIGVVTTWVGFKSV